MGNNQNKSKKQLSVATLNFAGIAHSPFEFYSGTEDQLKELEQISKIFQKLYNQSQKKMKNITIDKDGVEKWVLGNFDKNMQRQRYCPLYRKDVGVINGNLMSRLQFEKKWEQQYHKNQHYVKFNQGFPSNQQIEDCKLYDYLIFKTFVEYIYSTDDELKSHHLYKEPSLQDRETTQWRQHKNHTNRRKAFLKYENLLNSHFSKPYLKLDIKLRRINQIIKKNDILFLQDASDELLNALKNEGKVNIVTCQDSDCAIILKESFNKIYDQKKILQNKQWPKQKQQALKNLSPQNFKYSRKDINSVVCFVDQFILINVHLSSTDGYKQILKFMKHLLNLKQISTCLSIIAGGDFNKDFIFPEDIPQIVDTAQIVDYKAEGEDKQKIKSQSEKKIVIDFYTKFSVYPKDAISSTTSKKRTSLQSQNHKAEKPDDACRDFLIISNNLIKSNQRMIPEQQKQLLTEQHPFDHKLVCMNVKLNK